MPTVISAPGVYIEEDASPAISVSQGATAIPLFIAKFNPLDDNKMNVITRISSWLEYSTLFDASASLSAHVTIVSTDENAETDPDPEVSEDAEITATSPAKKNKKSAKTEKGLRDSKYSYAIEEPNVSVPNATLALQLYFQNGGGVCYLCPWDGIDEAVLANLPELMNEAGDITLIASPESDSKYRQTVYSAVSATLEQQKGYFLLADSDNGDKPSGLGQSAHIAVYYPSLIPSSMPMLDTSNIDVTGYIDAATNEVNTLDDLKKINPILAQEVSQKIAGSMPDVLVSPCAIMAGVYCKTDRERGVWKAPANVTLNGVKNVSVRVSNAEQGQMNLSGINVIRQFSDRGIVVWGARTQQDDDNWRYIPVRRLFDSAQRDIKKAMRPMVFEPNSQPTWKRVHAAIDHYLRSLWQQGGLTGNKPEEAYFVRIGKDITMTEDDIKQGKMIVQVGMAAVRPAEFIILQFTQDVAQ